MAMSYDSALIASTDIVTITGTQDLSNLTTDGELVLANFVLEAHRAIYRKLEGGGIDPTLLTNQDRLKSAVAYESLKRLAMGGYLDPLNDRLNSVKLYADQVEEELRAFRPVYSAGTGDPPRVEGVPSTANLDSGWFFGPEDPRRRRIDQQYFDDIPRPI